MDEQYKKIVNLYSKATFTEKYGLDMWVAVIICIIFFIAITYFTILNNIQPIKADWLNKRCDPAVIPFAGIINNGSDTTPLEFTGNNFTYCIRSILETIVGYAFKPLYYMISMISSIFSILAEAVNAIRELFNKMRKSITGITKNIMGRALNFVVPIMQFIVNFKAVMNKALGSMVASINSVMASYLGAQSLMLFLIKMFIMVLVGLVIMIAAFWMIPFIGPVMAIAAMVVFMLLLIPTIRMRLFMDDILDLQVASPPNPPACFSRHTHIILRDNEVKTIDTIEIGDTLLDGSIVTGTMKLSSAHQSVYIINDILVTGNHSIYHNNLGWISVEEHPDSCPSLDFNDPYVYCINTNTKLIRLGKLVFADWDDLDNIDLADMNKSCVNIGLLPNNFNIKDIHYYLDCGFHEDTIIHLQSGKSTSIKNIMVNNILEGGEKVVGIVKINAKNIQGVYYYDIEGTKLKCSKNIDIINNHKINTSFINGNPIIGTNYLYHLVTNLGYFHIGELRVCDYNAGLEKFLKPRY